MVSYGAETKTWNLFQLQPDFSIVVVCIPFVRMTCDQMLYFLSYCGDVTVTVTVLSQQRTNYSFIWKQLMKSERGSNTVSSMQAFTDMDN